MVSFDRKGHSFCSGEKSHQTGSIDEDDAAHFCQRLNALWMDTYFPLNLLMGNSFHGSFYSILTFIIRNSSYIFVNAALEPSIHPITSHISFRGHWQLICDPTACRRQPNHVIFGSLKNRETAKRKYARRHHMTKMSQTSIGVSVGQTDSPLRSFCGKTGASNKVPCHVK